MWLTRQCVYWCSCFATLLTPVQGVGGVNGSWYAYITYLSFQYKYRYFHHWHHLLLACFLMVPTVHLHFGLHAINCMLMCYVFATQTRGPAMQWRQGRARVCSVPEGGFRRSSEAPLTSCACVRVHGRTCAFPTHHPPSALVGACGYNFRQSQSMWWIITLFISVIRL